MPGSSRSRAEIRSSARIRLGRQLKAAWKASKLTQIEFAQGIGVSDRFVQKVHTGAASPSPELLDKWLTRLGVSAPERGAYTELLHEIQLGDARRVPRNLRAAESAAPYQPQEDIADLADFLRRCDAPLHRLDQPLRGAIIEQLKGHIAAWAKMVRDTAAREGPPSSGGLLGATRPRRHRAAP
jgi:transcriptional regulator with XRE-family HTH domain